MLEPFLQAIDWSRAWLRPLRPVADPILRAADWRAELNRAASALQLVNANGCAICFVEQADLPSGTPYESFIHETGKVPTRGNLHDFLNALVWLAYPSIKQQLNALQAGEIAKSQVVPASDHAPSGGPRMKTRGALRDAATIFDENAALLVVDEIDLVSPFQRREWTAAFVDQRTAFGRHCEVLLFGHALMEKLVNPYKAITAHAMCVQVAPDYFHVGDKERRAIVDASVSGALSFGKLAMDQFVPLPVAGVPGWWEGQDNYFYADTSVFRPLLRG
ncbi:MAG: hypothetical protein JWR21_623 [Herminiimonas sp.]|nr:hypothetical protein [Herminiimonas sp.]MDB5853378.1 hypothetical protein [Herminiimonas sp.]